MALSLLGPAPIETPNTDTDIKSGRPTGYFPIPWSDWFNAVFKRLQSILFVLASTSKLSQSASIGTTLVTTAVLAAGMYRISYYLVETRADNIGSSVSVSLGWTDKGTSRTLTGPALTANSVLAAQSGSITVRIDASTPLTYSTTYATTGGAPSMVYDLVVLAEQLPQAAA